MKTKLVHRQWKIESMTVNTSMYHKYYQGNDDMNMNYEKNLSDALLKLQESLNEIVTNTYLLGVNDGYKLGLKGTWEDGSKPSDDILAKPISKLDPQKSTALQEAEKILRDYL